MKLPLTRPLSNQPAGNSLPLPLTRKLGEQSQEQSQDGLNEQAPNLASKPKPPPKNPFGRLVGGDVGVCVAVAGSVSSCGNWTHDGKLVGQNQAVARQPVTAVADCLYLNRLPFAPIANVSQTTVQRGVLLQYCHVSLLDGYRALTNCQHTAQTPSVAYQSYVGVNANVVVGFTDCVSPSLDAVISHQTCLAQPNAKTWQMGHCHASHVQHATPVPCRYYPIPKPPPPPAVFACRLRPPAGRLPLTLTRRKGLPASALPLPLMCWHDVAPAFVPNLRSYLVHHIITATLGGLNIDPIKFDIKTDMDSYCWSGNIEISHVDYQRIKAKLDVERGNEPLILVNVNGKAFGFIAENVSRKRQFGASVYQLSGRSSTARLGQDYAHSQGLNGGGTIEQDLYASQIMRMQLNDLPFSIDEFDVDDWFIPSGTLNVSNQTPISIISQLATACGGKVISHVSEPKLSIIKRWRVPAWEMATAKPSLVVPMDVVHSISDEKRTSPRHNTVTLIGRQEAFEIYRQGQGRDLIAPVANWYLYTDQASAIARGVQLLSDSGNHVHYTLKMLVSDKHNLPLAKLGQIWQINDDTDGGDGAFNALITSVALSVSRDNDAVAVWQTVGMDRYVDV